MARPTQNGRKAPLRRSFISLIDPDFDPPTCAPVDGKVNLKGVSNAGKIRVYVDDVLVATLSAADNPTGSWTIPIPITPGEHFIRVEDGLGNSVTKKVEIPGEGCECVLEREADEEDVAVPVRIAAAKHPSPGPAKKPAKTRSGPGSPGPSRRPARRK